jgi:hypothetical protein
MRLRVHRSAHLAIDVPIGRLQPREANGPVESRTQRYILQASSRYAYAGVLVGATRK